LRQQSGDDTAAGKSHKIRVDRNARRSGFVLLRLQLHDPRGAGAGGQSNGKSAQRASRKQPNGAPRQQKDHRTYSADRQRRQHHRPAADLVGKFAKEKHRGQCPGHIDREDEREHDLGEAEAAAIHHIQRGWDRAQQINHYHGEGDDPHRRCRGGLN